MINLNITDAKFKQLCKELEKDFDIRTNSTGIKTKFELNKEAGYKYQDGKLTIYYLSLSDVPFIISELFLFNFKQNKEKYFKRATDLTYMIDCSRNAVITVETCKKLIRHLAVFGYTSLMLYCEDTMKVKEYPYMGYLRNAYSPEQIKKIETYANIFGIELIPCIQTLAHYNAIARYPTMENLFDVNDILLCDNKETYTFLEAVIKTCRSSFKSKKINIGMDEAYMIGRGRYLDEKGYKDRFEIMTKHVSKVIEICKKYNFEPMMWSDMFFSRAFSGQYKDAIPEEIKKQIPKGVDLIYWDYGAHDEDYFCGIMNKHKELGNKVRFAGGAWKWTGFTPNNAYSLVHLKESMKATLKCEIDNYIVTGWGDNGGECSQFSTLPSLIYAGRMNYGFFEIDRDLKEKFLKLEKISFDEFMKIDLANIIRVKGNVKERATPNKYLLFNDPLLGVMDTIVDDKQGHLFADHAKKLENTCKTPSQWRYLFKTQYLLNSILSEKATIGIDLRKAYQEHDKKGMQKCLERLNLIKKGLVSFDQALRHQWESENYVNGYDVQDLRIGGIQKRINVAIDKVTKYLKDSKNNSIPELNERLLCFDGHGESFVKDYGNCEYRWRRISSVNVNE